MERNRTDFEMIALAFDAFYAIFSTANDLKMVQIAFEQAKGLDYLENLQMSWN